MSFIGIDDHDGVVVLTLARPPANALDPVLLAEALAVLERSDADPFGDVVQSAFPEVQQGEISGLSRCVSNLGSSLGTAGAGSILISSFGGRSYAAAIRPGTHRGDRARSHDLPPGPACTALITADLRSGS